MKKEYGGPNLKDFNLCLLGSWVKIYIRDENKIWRKIVDRKYCSRNNILYADQNGASPFWKGVMLAAKALKFGYRWNVGNGGKSCFGKILGLVHHIWLSSFGSCIAYAMKKLKRLLMCGWEVS
jgi:hypothetical protein